MGFPKVQGSSDASPVNAANSDDQDNISNKISQDTALAPDTTPVSISDRKVSKAMTWEESIDPESFTKFLHEKHQEFGKIIPKKSGFDLLFDNPSSKHKILYPLLFSYRAVLFLLSNVLCMKKGIRKKFIIIDPVGP